MDGDFPQKKDDLKTTITPEEVVKVIKDKLPELNEVEVFGNKFTNIEAIFWLCIICLPIILFLSFRKNELWSLLNIFWCLGIINNQVKFIFNYLIYSNFGNIFFQLLFILFYIWDIGTIYQLEGSTGKSMRNWCLLLEFILVLIELILLALLLKNESLQKEDNIILEDPVSDNLDNQLENDILKTAQKPKQVIEEPKRFYPQGKKDDKIAIRRPEDDEP